MKANPQGTVAVIEPWSDGHRANYARLIVRGLAASGNNVVLVTTAGAFRDPVMKEIAAVTGATVLLHEVGEVTVPAAAGAIRLLARETSLWLQLRAMARAAQKNHSNLSCCVLPYVDYCYHAMALLGPPLHRVPWVGITMRSAVNGRQGVRSWRERLLNRIASKNCMTTLFTIDPRAREYNGGALPTRLKYLPDPVDLVAAGDRKYTRSSLGISEDCCLVSVLGSIDERKGIVNLLTALSGVPDQMRVAVLVAGRVLARTRPLLEGSLARELLNQGKLLVVDRRLDDREIADFLQASDYAWLGYAGHEHMSGIFLLAAVAGVPIIATRQGAIGYLARNITEVIMVDPADVDQVGNALREAGQVPRRRRPAAECASWASEYSPQRFARDVASAVRLAQESWKSGRPALQVRRET